MLVLSFVFAATWFISTSMAAHLPRLILAAGATAATAILIGSLIGPSQVAARRLGFGLLRRVHPLLSARLAAALHPLGVVLLLIAGPAAAPVFGVLHAGNGILTIAKGALPLVIFGPHGYGPTTGPVDGAGARRTGAGAMAVRISAGRLGGSSPGRVCRPRRRSLHGAFGFAP